MLSHYSRFSDPSGNHGHGRCNNHNINYGYVQWNLYFMAQFGLPLVVLTLCNLACTIRQFVSAFAYQGCHKIGFYCTCTNFCVGHALSKISWLFWVSTWSYIQSLGTYPYDVRELNKISSINLYTLVPFPWSLEIPLGWGIPNVNSPFLLW